MKKWQFTIIRWGIVLFLFITALFVIVKSGPPIGKIKPYWENGEFVGCPISRARRK